MLSMGKPTVVAKPTQPTPPETPSAKAKAQASAPARKLRLERRADGEWELFEDVWASAPTSTRLVKTGPRSVLGDYARLWHEEYMGPGRVGDLPL